MLRTIEPSIHVVCPEDKRNPYLTQVSAQRDLLVGLKYMLPTERIKFMHANWSGVQGGYNATLMVALLHLCELTEIRHGGKASNMGGRHDNFFNLIIATHVL
jgi:hypothetical protein